ncbi:MAG: NAD-dependent epimerase/dehydratase family protein [Chitinophagales bacterium]|jgi:UDP-glucose 4-epimerase|nr:NAD-dependent epimerase/dehydratase family protein [Chitinophagales bacterium]
MSYKRTILITGVAGQVASCLCDALVSNPENLVVGFDNLLTGFKENLPMEADNFKFFELDCNSYTDMEGLFAQFSFDYIYHYAAVVGVKRTLAHPLLVLDDIKGTENILKLANAQNVKRVFFSSSSEVYGEPLEHPQHEETTPLNARLPYACVKKISELYIKAFHEEFGLNYTIFRFFNTYGPKQSKDFVMKIFVESAKNGLDIPIYGEGNQTRTFCYIDDNVEITSRAMYEDLFVNDTVNIGNDNEMTIKELAQTVIDELKSSSQIIHLPALPAGDMMRRRPNVDKMKAQMKRPHITIQEGIRKML